ncbi:LysR family transcriptional regulator [Vibrio sp. HN007]|uniref:LysR family transcriptional regulator n=1 Tax=Vibrio iocasae TaxID=3098914 RepID=UPI0035D4828C
MDKFKAISYFIDTVELGSFTSAAKRHNVPASSISRRVADLEASLGAQLLVRSTRSVALTEVGAAYLVEMKSLMGQLKQSENMVQQYQSKPTGVLKISSTVGFGETVLRPILDEFRVRYPDVVLDVVMSDTLSNLDKDDVDIAIRGGYAPDERVIALRLIDNDFIAAASPEYINSVGLPEDTLELKQHKALLFKTPSGPIPWLSEIDGQWQNVSGNPALISNNGRWLLEKAIEGEGIIMLPEWSLRPALESGDLVALSFEQSLRVNTSGDLAIFLLYQKLDYAIPKVKVAVDFIAARVKQKYAVPGHA